LVPSFHGPAQNRTKLVLYFCGQQHIIEGTGAIFPWTRHWTELNCTIDRFQPRCRLALKSIWWPWRTLSCLTYSVQVI